ncbi:HAD-IIIC family phosphatase [Candidatus Lokiarchaeum ossiferum]|uniref:HAD-IIIC family phosphatase n=1 Tax=Candidatus Lokiarchaeum ossiferum TaxID=2951803 RepID=UPI00352F28C0
MENIKLIIWDLDDTLWKGTLSEGSIRITDKRIDLIKNLSKKGIMNAIASKNDFNNAKKELENIGIWKYFIFPHISWEPKGQMIKNIINNTQLRQTNVLFIDDNHLNREEVAFYNPNVNVVGPEFIQKIKSHPAFIGKNDSELTRLKQYKILEKKNKAQMNYSDNEEFLKQSKIKIMIQYDCLDNINRIHELINRTNQLNYTKNRITLEKLSVLLKDNSYINFIIKVTDKYGDYGIAGFVSLKKEENYLEHFIFSCRILNLGVENYIYKSLNYPKIEIIEEVATPLSKSKNVYWIKQEIKKKKNLHNKTELSKKQLSILIKGGCDLEQMDHYLYQRNLKILREFNSVLENNHPIHREHTSFIINSQILSKNQKNAMISNIPFLDQMNFETNIFDLNSYDILVYSVLMDYTQEMYQSKKNEIKIAYGGYTNIISEDPDEFESRFRNAKISGMDKNFHNFFKENFEYIGLISVSEFKKNLEYIVDKIGGKPIIFINGSEVHPPSSNKVETNSLNRHIEMNNCLDEFIKSHKNCYLLDVRKIVKQEDILDNIRHYKRRVYLKMAVELKFLITQIIGTKKNDRESNNLKKNIAALKLNLKAKLSTLINIIRRIFKKKKKISEEVKTL